MSTGTDSNSFLPRYHSCHGCTAVAAPSLLRDFLRFVVCVYVYCIAVFYVCFFWVFFTFVASFRLVLWHCWLGLLTCKTVFQITYTVLVETLNRVQSINHHSCHRVYCTVLHPTCGVAVVKLWHVSAALTSSPIKMMPDETVAKLGELEETTRTPLYYVDEDYPVGSEIPTTCPWMKQLT